MSSVFYPRMIRTRVEMARETIIPSIVLWVELPLKGSEKALPRRSVLKRKRKKLFIVRLSI